MRYVPILAALTVAFGLLSAVSGRAQPTAYLDAPRGTTTYVSPNTPLPVITTTFSSTGTGTLSASTTTSNLALPANGSIVEVTNNGSVTAFVALGVGSGTTATTSSFAVPAGQVVFLNTGTATYIAGITASSTASLAVSVGNLTPVSSGGGGPTSNVNVAQVNGVTPAVTQVIGGIAVTPSSVAGIGITPVVSASAENNHVLKNAAGNLYSVYATNLTGTAGFLVVLNATSAPADGAITPLACVALPPNGTASLNIAPGPPEVYSTGITAVVTSANTCFTKTTGVITAFFSGAVQ